MASSQDKGRALPKFGEWDAKNPSSSEGFTVIFQKAREEKKPATTGPAIQTLGGNNNKNTGARGGGLKAESLDSPKGKFFCCF